MPSIELRKTRFDIVLPEYVDTTLTESWPIASHSAVLVLREMFRVLAFEELKEYQAYLMEEEVN